MEYSCSKELQDDKDFISKLVEAGKKKKKKKKKDEDSDDVAP